MFSHARLCMTRSGKVGTYWRKLLLSLLLLALAVGSLGLGGIDKCQSGERLARLGPVDEGLHWECLGGGVLGDSLGALGDGVLGELTGEEEADGGLDLAGGEGLASCCSERACHPPRRSCSKMSLMKEFITDMPVLEMPVSGCTCLSTL